MCATRPASVVEGSRRIEGDPTASPFYAEVDTSSIVSPRIICVMVAACRVERVRSYHVVVEDKGRANIVAPGVSKIHVIPVVRGEHSVRISASHFAPSFTLGAI